jgi:rSAM/selenodomain-associated transferase 1
MAEPTAIAILAKAPVAGLAKTRLIPVLGADGAAALQARLIERTLSTACAAALGPVTLWAAPDAGHPAFHAARTRFGVRLAAQPAGDLGARMLSAIVAAAGAVLVIGTDCPALTGEHLHEAAAILHGGSEVVVVPAADGGYVLIGMRAPEPALFADMSWGSAQVMEETRHRLRALGRSWRELGELWDVDRPADLERLRAAGLQQLMAAQS